MSKFQELLTGKVKFKDGKKWKDRYCVVSKLSKAADHLRLHLTKDMGEYMKLRGAAASFSDVPFAGLVYGFEDGRHVDGVRNVIVFVCSETLLLLAFETFEEMNRWRQALQHNLVDVWYRVRLARVEGSKLATGQDCYLHVQSSRVVLVSENASKVVWAWDYCNIKHFGLVDDHFVLVGSNSSGKGRGSHYFSMDSRDKMESLHEDIMAITNDGFSLPPSLLNQLSQEGTTPSGGSLDIGAHSGSSMNTVPSGSSSASSSAPVTSLGVSPTRRQAPPMDAVEMVTITAPQPHHAVIGSRGSLHSTGSAATLRSSEIAIPTARRALDNSRAPLLAAQPSSELSQQVGTDEALLFPHDSLHDSSDALTVNANVSSDAKGSLPKQLAGDMETRFGAANAGVIMYSTASLESMESRRPPQQTPPYVDMAGSGGAGSSGGYMDMGNHMQRRNRVESEVESEPDSYLMTFISGTLPLPGKPGTGQRSSPAVRRSNSMTLKPHERSQRAVAAVPPLPSLSSFTGQKKSPPQPFQPPPPPPPPPMTFEEKLHAQHMATKSPSLVDDDVVRLRRSRVSESAERAAQGAQPVAGSPQRSAGTAQQPLSGTMGLRNRELLRSVSQETYKADCPRSGQEYVPRQRLHSSSGGSSGAIADAEAAAAAVVSSATVSQPPPQQVQPRRQHSVSERHPYVNFTPTLWQQPLLPQQTRSPPRDHPYANLDMRNVPAARNSLDNFYPMDFTGGGGAISMPAGSPPEDSMHSRRIEYAMLDHSPAHTTSSSGGTSCSPQQVQHNSTSDYSELDFPKMESLQRTREEWRRIKEREAAAVSSGEKNGGGPASGIRRSFKTIRASFGQTRKPNEATAS